MQSLDEKQPFNINQKIKYKKKHLWNEHESNKWKKNEWEKEKERKWRCLSVNHIKFYGWSSIATLFSLCLFHFLDWSAFTAFKALLASLPYLITMCWKLYFELRIKIIISFDAILSSCYLVVWFTHMYIYKYIIMPGPGVPMCTKVGFRGFMDTYIHIYICCQLSYVQNNVYNFF